MKQCSKKFREIHQDVSKTPINMWFYQNIMCSYLNIAMLNSETNWRVCRDIWFVSLKLLTNIPAKHNYKYNKSCTSLVAQSRFGVTVGARCLNCWYDSESGVRYCTYLVTYTRKVWYATPSRRKIDSESRDSGWHVSHNLRIVQPGVPVLLNWKLNKNMIFVRFCRNCRFGF